MKSSVAAVLLCAYLLRAQDTPLPEEPDWQSVCKKAASVPLETVRFRHNEAWLRSCDATALYYGFGSQPDYAAARECALYQRGHPDPSRGDPFAGPGILAMLYANGVGVGRNYALAIRFACEDTWAAPAENRYRIGHLEELQQRNPPQPKQFDLCDDATSGLMMGACEDVTQRSAGVKRDRDLAALVAAQHWNAAAQSAFHRLQAAERAFEQARTANEIDLSGTARAMFASEEEGRLRDQFLINFRRFASGDVPAANVTEAAQVRTELNAALDKIRTLPASTWEWGTVKPEGIEKTQAAWNAVEQAWLALAAQAFPAVTSPQVQTQLDRLRLHQLRSLARA